MKKMTDTNSNGVKQFVTPDLPYAYDALEPYMDEATMHIHHDKHHVAYTTNLNKALESQPELYQKTIEEILMDINQVKEEIRPAVRNHGGGHLHHGFFWEILRAARDNNKPEAELAQAIDNAFSSFEKFKEEFSKMAMSVFGSGWAWLSWDGQKLLIEKTPNQDSPYGLGHTPIMTIDIWEHAYYLKYQNRRVEFIEAFWPIINWTKANENYLKISPRERSASGGK